MRDTAPRASAMDSKRKANVVAAASEDLDDRAAKRRKPSDIDLSGGETAETTTQKGLLFLEQVKRTADKSGRLVATNFLTLPSKREIPEYYNVIKMPIAIDTIEAKLNRREFPNLTALESYFKRMVSNAKEFNERGSEIYDDAERLRKALSNHMTRVNPAYRLVKGYTAIATPIPGDGIGENGEGSDEDAEGEVDTEVVTPAASKRRGRPSIRNPGQVENGKQQRKSSTPDRPVSVSSQHSNTGFVGLTFQQAQKKIITDIINHKDQDDDEEPYYEPFINLLPRQEFKDYYQVIPHPVSLNSVKKSIDGGHDRGSTGVTEFKTWAAFEEEVAHIWLNAQYYNEDGSDIHELSKELQVYFLKKLKEAKATVAEPSHTKIKLKMAAPEPTPKITLRMGPKGGSAESPAPPAGLNGSASRNPFSGPPSAVPNLVQLERASSMSGSVASPTSATSAMVKNEDIYKKSPSIQPASLNPANGARPVLQHSSSNTYVNGKTMLPPTAGTPGHPSQNPYLNGQYIHPTPYHAPAVGYESRWRATGKTAKDAMIMNLSLATHPGLNITHHFHMDLPPSDTMSQQSITINLPSTHYYLQIKPTIAAGLQERQHKLFVTSGTQRLHAMPTVPGTPIDNKNPLFEARLLPGVNRIEVELIAALPKGAPRPASGQDVELEKVTIFANLLRS